MSPCLNFTLYSDARFPRNWWKNDVRTLTKLCQEFAGSHYSIEIVHLAEERQRAFRDGVFSTPTVLLEVKGGRKQTLGNFAKTKEFLIALKSPAPVPAQRSDSRELGGAPFVLGFAPAS